MKKLLLFIVLLISTTAFSQNPIKFKLRQATISTGTNGNVINRGDEFELWVDANGNGNTTTRQLLFDFQYDQTNFEIISITHTGTGGNGGVLPGGSTIQLSWQNYPGYSYAGNTTNTDGTVRYSSGLSYTYNANGSGAILRSTLSWATNSGMPYGGHDRLLILKFRLKAASTAYTFQPIKLNFVAGWDVNGGYNSTLMESPLSSTVNMNQNFGKYVTAKVDISSNLYNVSGLKLSFKDTLTNQGQLFTINSNGTVDINQSLLAANKVYEVAVMHEMDRLYAVYNSAITISDFTTAQSEFTGMGPGATTGGVLQTGQSMYAADINRSRAIDGGDLPQLLAQVAGIDTLFMLPIGYTVGSGGWMSLPTWVATQANTIGGATEWCVITPNSYSNGVSKVLIDVREFTGTNINPNTINSLQLFDLYSGPAEFVSNDGTWATYKIPSALATIATSNYLPFIRQINNGPDYGVKAEFEFNINPANTWSSLTTTNWKDITYPKAYFKTGTLGTNAILDLKYLLWGDVNRSHSSQVVTTNGGTSTVQTNAANMLSRNTAFITTAEANSGYINTSTTELNPIDVSLNNVTVTSNNIEIPVSINTNNSSLGGVQFEFQYDPNKIKFEELKSELPNTWMIFANSKEGKVKFGAIDQNSKSPIKGNAIPFKLKFSTIGQGVDILTSVKVSPVMDASAANGTQLGINLNTTTIKLTGYNNF